MKNLRLKAARAALDMSQAELAKRVNVSRQTIVAIEKGDYNPTIKLCIAICHELGKTLDELFWEMVSLCRYYSIGLFKKYEKEELKNLPHFMTLCCGILTIETSDCFFRSFCFTGQNGAFSTTE